MEKTGKKIFDKLRNIPTLGSQKPELGDFKEILTPENFVLADVRILPNLKIVFCFEFTKICLTLDNSTRFSISTDMSSVRSSTKIAGNRNAIRKR